MEVRFEKIVFEIKNCSFLISIQVIEIITFKIFIMYNLVVSNEATMRIRVLTAVFVSEILISIIVQFFNGVVDILNGTSRFVVSTIN